MKKVSLFVVFLAFGSGMVHMFFRQGIDSTSDRVPAPESDLTYSAKPDLVVRQTIELAPSPIAMKSDFDADLSRVKTVLGDLEDDTDSERADENFKKSGLDTKENYVHAHTILSAQYRVPVTRADAERRVLALHFLGASNLLSGNDCLRTLETQIAQFSGSNPQVRKALLWDIYSIAQLCGKSNSDEVEALAKQANFKELGAQMNLALTKLREQSIQ